MRNKRNLIVIKRGKRLAKVQQMFLENVHITNDVICNRQSVASEGKKKMKTEIKISL